jgi:low molecular weight protein-tyrosine phosphatase
VPFTVLLVCTGNVSRSPMAELLFRASVDPAADVAVSSAGVAALVGEPMDRGSASAIGQLGLDPSRHRARQFEPAMAAGADLVLTAERAHREAVLAQVPAALRRVFTIKEFARIAPHLKAADPREAVEQAAVLRGVVRQPTDPAQDDVADPHLQSTAVNQRAAAELTVAVRAIAAGLRLAPGTVPAAAPAPARRPLPYRR